MIDEKGKHIVADLVPLVEDAGDYWLSPLSGSQFSTKWFVQVPSLDIEFEVTSKPREQEDTGLLARYEGSSSVNGTVRGEKVNGYCYVEMVGDWNG